MQSNSQKIIYSVFAAADWFLGKVECDHKKLQKLCYYAQSWSLALMNRRIINSEFEAWVHGPVCRELWDKCRDFGFETIPENFLDEYRVNFDDESESLLEKVLSTYGEYSGYDLECLTHTEKPWIVAREGYSPVERCHEIISDKMMTDYYRTLIVGDGIGE